MNYLQKRAAELNMFTFPKAYADESAVAGRVAELGSLGATAGAGVLAGLTGGSLAASLSHENKVRNAILAGLLFGAIGAGTAYGPSRQLASDLHGKYMRYWTKKNAPWVNLP